MLHALHFRKKSDGEWSIYYNNRYVESETFKLETQLNKPSFLPAIEGDSLAVLAAYVLNMWRFGKINKHLRNTSVFEHGGKVYAIAENYLPQEIDVSTLLSLEDWDVNGAWDRPFTSHPKKAPGTGELVVFGVDALEPYFIVGVISADGKKLLHKADLKFKRSILTHEIGVTQKYNIILDHPITIDISRLYKGGSLLDFEKGGPARIGVMPRYGDADSVKWFEVESYCTFHLLNCFEEGEEVVVRGCKAPAAILACPELGENKFQWFSRGFNFQNNAQTSEEYGYLFHHVHEWRLNMVTGQVHEQNLSGTHFSMDFPLVNGDFIGLKHKFGYTQVIDSKESSSAGMTKYGALAKLYFDEEPLANHQMEGNSEQAIKIEYHKFEENVFCTGMAFVPKVKGSKEDDGWIITYVHNEESNMSQAYIVDASKFESEPTAVVTLPQRVPYGFHGLFVCTQNQA
ncbi:hypothetical protein MANES_03G057750v8 [Manihot esculenta]|uniref:Uncharacterized protein n=2 Tax=Manihot esculenta TaxID=3983 RepID=A0ACB7HZQ8_MANES|nr:hypothetical protein MANES_03G057750v8 [Manihot esculenta]